MQTQGPRADPGNRRAVGRDRRAKGAERVHVQSKTLQRRETEVTAGLECQQIPHSEHPVLATA